MDKYDEAVAYLTAHPEQIYQAWSHDTSGSEEATISNGIWYPPDFSGCLFDIVHDRNGYQVEIQPELEAQMRGFPGCLTQVAAGTHLACTRDLTIAIRADARIPIDPDDITVDDLPVFAEWQRRLDKELGRDE